VNPHRRLLLAAQPLDGGVARHVIAVAKGVPEELFAVDVACPRASLTWDALEGRPGVSLHAIQAYRRPAPADVLSLQTLQRLAGSADVVHVHSAKAGFLGRLAAFMRGKGRTCIFTPHAWSFWAVRGLEAQLYLRLERLAANWCNTIVALSADERDAGLRAGVGRVEQYRVIPNGVPLERFAVPRAPQRGKIVVIGRLARQKRPDLALRALTEARARIPEASLDFVGDGPLRAETERLAVELGVQDAVHVLGNRDDVPELLARAECVLLTSDYEGSPLAVAEAMAAGVAVVATDAVGTSELVLPGRTGSVVARGDVQGLAAALADVLEDPRRAAELGAEGRRAAEARFSLDVMVERLVELYGDIGKTPPRRRD
jgi:glycosyltransferase involved in cell wall biosynthesis